MNEPRTQLVSTKHGIMPKPIARLLCLETSRPTRGQLKALRLAADDQQKRPSESEASYWQRKFGQQLKETGFYKYHFNRVSNELRVLKAEFNTLKNGK